MGALYIKDEETSRIVAEAAMLRGISKRLLVKELAESELTRLKGKMSLRERLAAWRTANPLPPATGPRADKAFYDRLNGEDER